MHDRGERDGRDGQAGTRFPQGMRRHEEPDFGFAIEVPRRFIRLTNTVDPIAQMMRVGAAQAGREGQAPGGDEEKPGGEEQAWPTGFCDPEVLGDIGDGRLQPLRLLEIDTLGRSEPLTDDEAAAFWFEAREVLPQALASSELPGYRLLDVRDATLGPLDALAFEWRWDGLRPGDQGGDRALLVWALHPQRVFPVYYHCCGDEWGCVYAGILGHPRVAGAVVVKRTYHIYAIRLDDAVLRRRAFPQKQPRLRGGQTVLLHRLEHLSAGGEVPEAQVRGEVVAVGARLRALGDGRQVPRGRARGSGRAGARQREHADRLRKKGYGIWQN